jgi:NADPH:quinone reductase-like Zn-dependent oxidoreductase
MKAVYRTVYGGPEILEVREVDLPKPKEKEVLIRIACTTVNRTDCGVVLGNYLLLQLFTGLGKPKNPIPGTDFSGTIEAVGSQVEHFSVGDRVYGLNDNSHATQAEYCTWPADESLIKIPEDVSFEEAVAGVEGGHYALNFLNKVKLNPGQRVMVNGGAGAIGSAAIQMLVDRGIHVVATCRPEHSERVLALGASRVIDYTAVDFTQQDEQYDFVFDAVGKSRFRSCKRIMKPGSAYKSSELGPNAENIPLSILGLLHRGKRVKFPVPIDIPRSLKYLNELFGRSAYKPLIDQTFALDNVQEAYTYVMSEQKVGSVLLKP